MKTQVVIYTNETFEIGGIETFTYNFCKAMAKHYDITVLYGHADPKQIERLEQMVQVIHNDGKTEIECDTLIMNRLQDKVPENVHAKKVVQMVHGCREAVSYSIHVPQDRDQIVCVSDTVKTSFGDETKDAIVIKNLVESIKPRQVLQLISATRLDTNEKGQKRMIELANRMNEMRRTAPCTISLLSAKKAGTSTFLLISLSIRIMMKIPMISTFISFASRPSVKSEPSVSCQRPSPPNIFLIR